MTDPQTASHSSFSAAQIVREATKTINMLELGDAVTAAIQANSDLSTLTDFLTKRRAGGIATKLEAAAERSDAFTVLRELNTHITKLQTEKAPPAGEVETPSRATRIDSGVWNR
jgi:hypothetical protein